MTKFIGKYKLVLYIFFLAFLINAQLVNASNSNELIEITQVVQDTNDVGIVLNDDISNHVSTGSYIYILVLLNQSSVFNGLYLVGFGVNDSITNYGSIIYFDILDYLIAFGAPDTVKGLIVSLPDSFDVIKDNIYPILIEYENSVFSTSTSTITTTNTTTSLSSKSSNSLSGFGSEIIFLLVITPILIRKIKK